MIVKIVPGVESTISEELVNTAVNLIGAGPRNRVDYPSRGLPVFSGVVAGQDGEFLNGIHAQASSKNASWRPVCVIVEANAIPAIIVLLRPCSFNAQLLAET